MIKFINIKLTGYQELQSGKFRIPGRNMCLGDVFPVGKVNYEGQHNQRSANEEIFKKMTYMTGSVTVSKCGNGFHEIRQIMRHVEDFGHPDKSSGSAEECKYDQRYGHG